MKPIVSPGEFAFAAVHLDHGHIHGMSEGLAAAGAHPKWVFDPDAAARLTPDGLGQGERHLEEGRVGRAQAAARRIGPR